MEQESSPSAFSPMAFPVRPLTSLSGGHYRVYSDERTYRFVEAATAAEALKASGIAAPLRIMRDVPEARILLDRDKLQG